jgi:hypothetical protein
MLKIPQKLSLVLRWFPFVAKQRRLTLKKGEVALKPPRVPPVTLKEEPMSVDPHCVEEEDDLSSEEDELMLTVESAEDAQIRDSDMA